MRITGDKNLKGDNMKNVKTVSPTIKYDFHEIISTAAQNRYYP